MKRIGLALLVAVSLALVAGCGPGGADLPELGQVKGKVTLDGKPVGNARVKFVPEDGAAATSFSLSDSSGEYELYFTKDVKGAAVGKHIVTIQVMPGAPGEESATLPAKYGSAGALTAEVKAGKNDVNFELTSE